MNNYRIKAVFGVFATVIFLVLFFLSPSSMINGMNEGMKLCATAVIPSLFPFMVLSDFVIRSGLGETAGSFIDPASRLFLKLPGSAGCAVIMSFVGGYPVGAKMTAQLLENGSISVNQAKRMMFFCVNAGPAFVIGMVGTLIFSSREAGVVLYLSMVISSLIMGIALRFLDDKGVELTVKKIRPRSGVAAQSITQGINSMLHLCACVVLFSCVISMVESLHIPGTVMTWFRMLAEVTSGCASSSKLFPLSVQALVIGFGGLSVHCQLLPYLKQANVKYLHFFISRIFHGGLSACVAEFLFNIFPCKVSVFSTNTDVLPKLYSVSVPAAVSMLFLAVMLITDLTAKFTKNKNDEA